MFCPVGCHLTDFGKFKRLKKFNPRLYDYCMEELGEKKLLDWVEKNYARGMMTFCSQEIALGKTEVQIERTSGCLWQI